MSRPAKYPEWALAGTNNDEPSSGQKLSGWSFEQIGVSDYDNWYKKLVYDWLVWLDSEKTKTISPFAGIVKVNWAPEIGGSDNYMLSSGLGQYYIPLDINVGDRLRDIKIDLYGDASAAVSVVVYRRNTDRTVTALATISSLVPAAAWASSRINFAADTGAGALTINVASGGPTFTRTSGSFITDGFAIGMTFTASGFTNAGNNVSKVISAVTDTVITVTSGSGLVTESGNGNERLAVTPVVTVAGESTHILFGTNAANIRLGAISMSYDGGTEL